MDNKKDVKESNEKSLLEKINVKKLNEGITIGSKILKILYVSLVILIIYLCGLILKEWKVLSIIGTILKIISPLFIGFVIAWLLNPLVTKLTKKGMSRTVAVILVFVALLVIIYLIILAIIPTLIDQLKDVVTIIPSILGDLKTWIENLFDKLSDLSLENLDSVKEKFFSSLEIIGTNLQTNLPEIAVNTVTSVVSGLGTILLSFIVGFYMLFNFHNVKQHFVDMLPVKVRKDTMNVTNKISEVLHNFVKGTLLLSLMITAISFIGFSIIGLNAPLLLAVFCGITNLIPYIGPYIGAAAAGLVGFTQGTGIGIVTLIFILVTQTLEGNFLQPLVMSKKMNLHPVTILISLLIFGYFFGIIGMIIATPIMALLKILYIFFDEKYHFFEYKDRTVKKENPKKITFFKSKKIK